VSRQLDAVNILDQAITGLCGLQDLLGLINGDLAEIHSDGLHALLRPIREQVEQASALLYPLEGHRDD